MYQLQTVKSFKSHDFRSMQKKTFWCVASLLIFCPCCQYIVLTFPSCVKFKTNLKLYLISKNILMRGKDSLLINISPSNIFKAVISTYQCFRVLPKIIVWSYDNNLEITDQFKKYSKEFLVIFSIQKFFKYFSNYSFV